LPMPDGGSINHMDPIKTEADSEHTAHRAKRSRHTTR
jgi:hypothetical protein